jgi:hypothetical protein
MDGSESEAGSDGATVRECKFLGIKSTDADPLGVAKIAPWTRYDPVSGQAAGKLSVLARKVCMKYYKNKTEAQVYKDIQRDERQKAVFQQLAQRFVEFKQKAFTFLFFLLSVTKCV